MQSKPDVESLSYIPKFHIVKEYSSGDVSSEFEEGQLTLLYSIIRNIMREKAAAAPSHHTTLVHPTIPDSRTMQGIVLNFLPYSMETGVTKQYHIFFSMTLLSCLAEGPSGLLLHFLYGYFPFLPGTFLFPAHDTSRLEQDSACLLHPSRVIVC